MSTAIVMLDGYRTGPKRIAERFAAERERVASFNRNTAAAGLPYRTTLWESQS